MFLLFLTLIEVSAQGRLLIVGGGAEKNGASSWSTPAYRWAVEGKRVAIIGTSTGSLAPYMKSQCGAAFAKEFAIDSRDSADSQVTFDTLITYEVVFFRGGDQWEYYDLYRNTKLQDAVYNIYNQGGCIGGTSAGMHILSAVVYTAENGSAYPYECIENPNNHYITLENDFMDLVPGFVFDTHFAERARFARLAGFLANYQFNQSREILGLGMDDMTCMTIDENRLGTVYGTGCANFYKCNGHFSQNGNKLLADSVQVIQLLQHCTYNFSTGEITYAGLDRELNTAGLSESGNYTILASGSNLLTDNQAMLNDLVTQTGSPTDDILLLSGDNALTESFKTKLLSLGAANVYIFNPTTDMGADTELANHIGQSSKILFLKNSSDSFSQFLLTPNGDLLQQKVTSDGFITAFAGDDARYAGKTVVENYLTYGASYYAELTFLKGLSLLRNTVIMPSTYLNSDIYENTATAVPYSMALDTLKFGIWLTNHNYMKYAPVSGKATLTGYGSAPVMVVANQGNLAGFSNQTATGSTSTLPRMVAGFEELKLNLIDDTTPYIMGDVASSGIVDNGASLQTIRIFPNPVGEALTLDPVEEAIGWVINGIDGREHKNGKAMADRLDINVSSLSPGLYFIGIFGRNNSLIAGARFIKE